MYRTPVLCRGTQISSRGRASLAHAQPTSMSCAYCAKPIKNTEFCLKLRCGQHLAHGTHNTTICSICPGPATTAAAAVGSVAAAVVPSTAVAATATATAPVAVVAPKFVSGEEQRARARRIADAPKRRKEPFKPYEPSFFAGVVANLLQVAGRVGEASIPDDESSDPFALLEARVPLKTLVTKHGFDITELINDHGVTIADIFRTCHPEDRMYTMSEMCDAFGSRMNRDEGMRVLYYLGMTDRYLTERPEQSQVDVMREKLGFSLQSLVSDLGYHFEPGVWTLGQMVDMGMTMDWVMKQGMRTWDEWDELRQTARNANDITRFAVTPALTALLLRFDQPSLPPVDAAPLYTEQELQQAAIQQYAQQQQQQHYQQQAVAQQYQQQQEAAAAAVQQYQQQAAVQQYAQQQQQYQPQLPLLMTSVLPQQQYARSQLLQPYAPALPLLVRSGYTATPPIPIPTPSQPLVQPVKAPVATVLPPLKPAPRLVTRTAAPSSITFVVPSRGK